MRIHQIRVDFQVTKEIQRYVYVYVLEAEYCYLIDSGVCGSQELICKTVRIIGTPGHSADGVSYQVGDAVFLGDTVPVKGDIPIYINATDTWKSLNKIAGLTDVKYYYPAWDQMYTENEMHSKLREAYGIVEKIGKVIREADHNLKIPELIDLICTKMEMPYLKNNPLFARTVAAYLPEPCNYTESGIAG